MPFNTITLGICIYLKTIFSTALQYLENLFFWKGKSSTNLSTFFLIEVFISTIELSSL